MLEDLKQTLTYLELTAIPSSAYQGAIDPAVEKRIRETFRISQKQSGIKYQQELTKKYPNLKDNCSILSLVQWVNVIQQPRSEQQNFLNSLFKPDISGVLDSLSNSQLAWLIFILRTGFGEEGSFEDYLNTHLKGVVRERVQIKVSTGKLMFLDERLGKVQEGLAALKEKVWWAMSRIKSVSHQQKIMIKIEESELE